jgi:hypothetical protein
VAALARTPVCEATVSQPASLSSLSVKERNDVEEGDLACDGVNALPGAPLGGVRCLVCGSPSAAGWFMMQVAGHGCDYGIVWQE